MKWHTGLTIEKWSQFPLETRIEMVRNELSRAQSAQKAKYYGGTRLAFERALELLDLTVETCIRETRLGRLLRWRERIARAYLFPEDLIEDSLLEAP